MSSDKVLLEIKKKHLMRKVYSSLLLLLAIGVFSCQSGGNNNPTDNSAKNEIAQVDSAALKVVNQIYDEALTNGEGYELLRHLCLNIGSRLSGSEGASDAVDWTKKVMEDYGFDSVYLQEVMVPHWERGAKETCSISQSNENLNILAIGGSVPTPANGLEAEVIMLDKLEDLNEAVKDKIVFFNYPFQQQHIRTGSGYGDAVRHRVHGPSKAAELGAKAVIIRSVTTSLEDDEPHTGTLVYQDSTNRIPAAALGVLSANKLAEAMKSNPNTKVKLKINSKWFPDALSYNVIGELKGSEKPEEVILVGGHLDAWDAGHGAHDDGTGCIHSIEVLRMFQQLKIQPKRTIRAVMFMNEENGMAGGKKYAEWAKETGEKHILAIESDAGGFTPRGFGTTASDEAHNKMQSFLPYFNHNTIGYIKKGGGGADIGHLNKATGAPIVGFMPDSQRYFDLHHSNNDTFDKVNRRELELGTASMATLVYLTDLFGLE
jgi:carboxypeptidase Q